MRRVIIATGISGLVLAVVGLAGIASFSLIGMFSAFLLAVAIWVILSILYSKEVRKDYRRRRRRPI